jgi:abortive infection bacteriophage resistance protein
LTTEQQLALMQERGLVVGDEPSALRELARLGYYRISGYYYPLRGTNPVGVRGRQNQFVDGASFELVVRLADFDKQLRLLALEALETLEVAIRVAIAYRLGRVSPNAHLEPDLLDKNFSAQRRDGGPSRYEDWLERFKSTCEKSREEFYKHHLERYGGEMPIWVAIEVWDFGLLSRFYEGMQKRDRDAVALKFAPVDGAVFGSWLRMLNFVRNVSAHHSRLWNRTLPEQAKLPLLERCRHLQPLHDDAAARRKMFAAFVCLRLMMRSICHGSP